MRISQLVFAGVMLGLGMSSSPAATLSFDPSTQNVANGATFNVSLNIAGLGSGSAPSLGVFDLDVSYDPTVLQFNSVSFSDPVNGDQLDLSGFGSVTDSNASTPGVVRHFELSLDLASTLDSLQAGAFTLSVFSFTALQPGISALELQVNSLGDAAGADLAATLQAGSVVVVPEPAVPAIVAGALLVWSRFRRARN